MEERKLIEQYEHDIEAEEQAEMRKPKLPSTKKQEFRFPENRIWNTNLRVQYYYTGKRLVLEY